MNNTPTLFIIAGPNGVGKTTSFFSVFPVNLPVINADEIAKQLREKLGEINVQEIANGEATKQINGYLAKKMSFGFETNLADNDTWEFIKRVQMLGYKIIINFFCVDNIAVCINRVLSRVKEGGHYVRPDIIQYRYENALGFLKRNKDIPDILELTDNTFEPINCLTLNKGEIIFQSKPLPIWIQNIIEAKEVVTKKYETIEEIRKRYQSLKSDDKL